MSTPAQNLALPSIADLVDPPRSSRLHSTGIDRPRPRSSSNFNPDQLDVAKQIYDIGRQRGESDDAIRAALSTGIVESNYNPSATGDNGSAIGVFQQRRQGGYDTSKSRDVGYAANAFYDNAKGVKSYNSPGHLAAQVQRPRSDLRGRYDEELPRADALFQQFGGSQPIQAPKKLADITDLIDKPTTPVKTSTLADISDLVDSPAAATPPNQGEVTSGSPTLPSRGTTQSPATFKGIRKGVQGSTDLPIAIPGMSPEEGKAYLAASLQAGDMNAALKRALQSAPPERRPFDFARPSGRFRFGGPQSILNTTPEERRALNPVPATAQALGGVVGSQSSTLIQPGSDIAGRGNRVFITGQRPTVLNTQEPAKPLSDAEQAEAAQMGAGGARLAEISRPARAVTAGSMESLGHALTAVAGGLRTEQDLIDLLPDSVKKQVEDFGRKAIGMGMTPGEWAQVLQGRVRVANAAIQEADKIKPMTNAEKFTAFTTNLVGDLGQMVLAADAVGPYAAFGGQGYFGARGQGESVGRSAVEGGKGVATAGLFGATEAMPVLPRSATVFGGSYGLEKATGASNEEALKSAAMNTAFSAAPSVVEGAKFLSNPRAAIQAKIEADLRGNTPPEVSTTARQPARPSLAPTFEAERAFIEQKRQEHNAEQEALRRINPRGFQPSIFSVAKAREQFRQQVQASAPSDAESRTSSLAPDIRNLIQRRNELVRSGGSGEQVIALDREIDRRISEDAINALANDPMIASSVSSAQEANALVGAEEKAGGASLSGMGEVVSPVSEGDEAPPANHELQPRRKINVATGTKGQFRKETATERDARRAQVALSENKAAAISGGGIEAEGVNRAAPPITPIPRDEQTIPAIGMKVSDIKDAVQNHLEGLFDRGEVDVRDIAVIGSHAKGTAKPGSDLDVLVEYGSAEDVREDGVFNHANSDENALYLNGVKVDINPVRADDSGTLDEWLGRHGYAKEAAGGETGASETVGLEGQKVAGGKDTENTLGEVGRVPSESEAGAGKATRPTKIGSAFWEDVPGGRVATTTRRPSETFALEAEVEKSGALQRLYEQGAISSPDVVGLRRAAAKRFQGNMVAIENAYHQALLKLSSTDVKSTARSTTFLPESVGGTPVKGEEGAKSDNTARVIQYLKDPDINGRASLEDIAEDLGLTTNEATSAVLGAEMSGELRQLPGRRFELTSAPSTTEPSGVPMRKPDNLSLTSSDLDLARLERDANIKTPLRLSKNHDAGKFHILPGGRVGTKFTEAEEARLAEALKRQGFTATKRTSDSNFNDKTLSPGGGWRIHGIWGDRYAAEEPSSTTRAEATVEKPTEAETQIPAWGRQGFRYAILDAAEKVLTPERIAELKRGELTVGEARSLISDLRGTGRRRASKARLDAADLLESKVNEITQSTRVESLPPQVQERAKVEKPTSVRGSRVERPNPRTGLTKTQTNSLASDLEGYAERHLIGTENYPKVENRQEGAELLAGVARAAKREPIARDFGKPETIKVPDDGEFTVRNVEEANRLHQKITGEPIEGLPKPQGARTLPLPQKGVRVPAWEQKANTDVDAVIEAYGGVKKAHSALQKVWRQIDADPEVAEHIGGDKNRLEELLGELESRSRQVRRGKGERGAVDISFLRPLADKLRKFLGRDIPELEPAFRLRGKREQQSEPSIRGRERGSVPEPQAERVPGTTSEGSARRASESVSAPEVGAQTSRQVDTERVSTQRPIRRAAVPIEETAKQEGVEPSGAPVARFRSFPKSAEEAGLTKGTNLTYEVVGDKPSVDRANRRIDSQGAERVAADIARTGEPTKDDIVAGQILARKYSESGDHEREVAVINDLAEKLTRAGQTVQAASLISRLSPEGVLLRGQKILNKRGANRTLTQEESTILKDSAQKVREAEVKISDLEKQIEQMRSQPTQRGGRTRLQTLEQRLAQAETDARARLAARKQTTIRGGQAGASIIPLDIADYSIIGASKLARRGISLAKWTDEMVSEFGEEIRPHLRKIYQASYQGLRDERAKMRAESQERTVRRENPSVTDAAEIKKLINQRLNAQTEARNARQELTRTFDRLGRTPMRRGFDTAMNALGLSRALVTLAPFHAAFRHTKMGLATHPIEWAKAAYKSAEALSTKQYERVVSEVQLDSDFKYAQKFKLGLTGDFGGKTGAAGMEEAFQSDFVHKIPGIKHSGQAFDTMVNVMRMGWFKQYMKYCRNLGLDPDSPNDALAFKQGADLINNATGRGTLPRGLDSATPTLNNIFFSTRFWASRLKLLTETPLKIALPESAGGFTRPARVEAFKTLFNFTALVGAQLTLAHMAGAKVSFNPDDPDFLQAGWGRFHLDLSAGLRTHIKTGIRLAEALMQDKSRRGRGISQKDFFDILGTYVRQREAPITSGLHDIAAGKNVIGEPVYAWGKPGTGVMGRVRTSRVAQMFTPMVLPDAEEGFNQSSLAESGAAGVAKAFGEGGEVYAPRGHRQR